MNRAVFLDRDGVINEDHGYIHKQEDFVFIDGIFDFCRTACEKGYLLIVVTNQSGIARGYYTEEDFCRLNDWMLGEFERRNITIARTYYCPYHPEKGLGRYKADSYDRKPNPGMFLRAKEEFELDMENSAAIGDKETDIEAARRAGVGTLILFKYPRCGTLPADVIAAETLKEAQLVLR